MPPPLPAAFVSLSLRLFATVTLVSTDVPAPSFTIPPPLPVAKFAPMVTLIRFRAPLLSRPPPLPAWLSRMVLLFTVREPLFAMPPPVTAWPALIVQFVNVSDPWLLMIPADPLLIPCDMIRSEMSTVRAGLISKIRRLPAELSRCTITPALPSMCTS